MHFCTICKQERHHAYFYVKRQCVCTDCGIAIVTLADRLGLAMVSKNLAKHQDDNRPMVSPVAPYGIIANNGANSAHTHPDDDQCGHSFGKSS